MTEEELREKIADKIIRWDTCGADGFDDMSLKAQNDYLILVEQILVAIREAGYKSPEEVEEIYMRAKRGIDEKEGR